MDIPALSVFVHVLSRCPCGHTTHIGRGFQRLGDVVCEECDVIAAAAGATLCIVPVETAELYAFSPGMNVQYRERTMVIADIEQVMLSQGRLPTPYVRVLIAEPAMHDLTVRTLGRRNYE